MKDKMVILTGPTAVGKTEISLKLAKSLNANIISADSMQVYKYMDIGTAKLKEEMMEGVKHYMIDEIMPDVSFDTFVFKKMAQKYIDEILSNGNIPLVVGGTGFYIQSLLYDIDFDEGSVDAEIRERLEVELRDKGIDVLYSKLQEVDPESTKIIHKNNTKRVIRALEYYNSTGEPISKHNKEQRQKESKYDSYYYVLTMDRKKLYDRINMRVDIMMDEGLEEEVRSLVDMGITRDMTSMQAIGYREWFDYFDGKITIDDVRENIKKDTRHFAKRQLTWFKREKDVRYIDKESFANDDEILDYIKKDMNG